jgi:hypothetical protein
MHTHPSTYTHLFTERIPNTHALNAEEPEQPKRSKLELPDRFGLAVVHADEGKERQWLYFCTSKQVLLH